MKRLSDEHKKKFLVSSCITVLASISILLTIVAVGFLLNSDNKIVILTSPPSPPVSLFETYNVSNCVCGQSCFQSDSILLYYGKFPDAAAACLNRLLLSRSLALIQRNNMIECHIFEKKMNCLSEEARSDKDQIQWLLVNSL